jgi:son of sevenless
MFMDPHADAGRQVLHTFFCRALYDYQSNDLSSLSFRRGDVIEVLTMLESGWWDGLLNDERGWFPSNYVVQITDEEAAAELMRVGLLSTQDLGAQESDWVQDQADYGRFQREGPGPIGQSFASNSNDFWVPEVTSDGQVSVYMHL